MIPAKKLERPAYLIGRPNVRTDPLQPFDDGTCQFLEDLSNELWELPEARDFSDVLAFAFFCRGANLRRLMANYPDRKSRLGLGLAFHIAASNVPVGFAFSFGFCLLAGNANLVRVPSRSTRQLEIISGALNKLFRQNQHALLAEMNAFYQLAADDVSTAEYSAQADARLIWGGDNTVIHLRSFPAHLRAVDLTFSDRHSLAILDVSAVAALNATELKALAEKFYNDTFAMDQAACSSPSFVVWKGQSDTKTFDAFWQALQDLTQSKYLIQPIQVMDKLTRFCQDAAEFQVSSLKKNSPAIFRAQLKGIDSKIADRRGGHGYFFELTASELAEITSLTGQKCQTVTYFGLDKNEILNFVLKSRLKGVDRIVPIGSALEMGLVWDGYDLIRSLSRIIESR